MNARSDLDREHIVGVCYSVVARPSTLRASGDEVTLLFASKRQRDRAGQALGRCGYATEPGTFDEVHRHGMRITGWSPDGLERRAKALRSTAIQFATDVRFEHTVAHAVVAAAQHSPNADPVSVSNDIAAEATDSVISAVINEVGPIIPLTRFPADTQLGEHVREVQRAADRLTSVIGDHFNVASIAANTYLHARREQPDDAARSEAWAEARAFIADPVDPDAFVEAAEWAHHRHPEEAGAFALDYAREYRGTDRDRRPMPEEAYPAWRDAPSATQVAAADFPHPPAAAPEQATDTTSERKPGATEARRPGRAPGGGPR